MSEGASRSASGTPTGTGSGTPSGTPTPSRTPTPSLTRGASPSGTGTPTPTPTPSPSMPANSTANCTLTPWGAWSSCEDACAALPYGGAVSRRSRTVAEPAGPLGHCPPAAELTEERACGVCATPSSSPLPSPPATCWNGVRDGDETDVDCGGGAGCPRCDAGQACGDTRDCVQPLLADLVVTAPAAPAGGGDSAGWGWSALGAYAGPAFVCAADAALDSDAGAAASPVCIDVRLSRAVYEAAAGAAVNSSNVTGGNATGNATGNGTSAGGVGVVLPTFLQLRVRVAGLPASARRGAVAVAVRAAIVRAASDAGIDLLNGDVVIASLAAPLPAPPGSPATGSSHGTANVTQHGNGTLAGNGTASNGTTGCVQPVNASSENATGTCNGTNTTASPTVSAGGNATNATVGNAPSGGNATGIVNATSGRRAADAASTLRARPALGVQLRSRRLAGAPATSSGAQSLDVAVRVLVPRGADNATLADGLNAGAGAQLAAALASELVAALNLTAAQAGNLTLTLVQRAAVVDALPALLAVTRSPVVAPVPAGEGAGSGGAAAAAVVLSLLALVVLGGAGVVRAHGVLRLPGLDPHSEAGLAATRALLPIATLCGAAPLGDHARWRLDERLADAHGGKPMSRVVTASAGQARASRSRAKAWLPGVSAAQAWPAASAAQVPVVHSPLAVVEAINRRCRCRRTPSWLHRRRRGCSRPARCLRSHSTRRPLGSSRSGSTTDRPRLHRRCHTGWTASTTASTRRKGSTGTATAGIPPRCLRATAAPKRTRTRTRTARMAWTARRRRSQPRRVERWMPRVRCRPHQLRQRRAGRSRCPLLPPGLHRSLCRRALTLTLLPCATARSWSTRLLPVHAQRLSRHLPPQRLSRLRTAAAAWVSWRPTSTRWPSRAGRPRLRP